MLVFTMKPEETSTLYTKDGKKIGEIKIVSIGQGKIRVGFEFPKDKIAIAGHGVSVEEALSIFNKLGHKK